ncbi:MAG TPA: PmoA family protein [Pirellulaceae bacterium]|jgi:hypothetical protein
MNRLAAINALVVCTLVSGNALAQSTVRVAAGDHDRTDALVTMVLPESLRGTESLKLLDVSGGKQAPVATQLDNASGRIWWVATGKIPAGEKRTYRVERGSAEKTANVALVETDRVIEIRYDDKPLLQYNKAHVEPPAGVNAKYGRSAHIHPVRTPNGAIVTDELPPDHLHQSGIFLAFTKTQFEGRDVDFWNLGGGKGRVRFKSAQAGASGPIFASFRTEHEHVDLTADNDKGEIGKTSGGKVALNETWDVRVWTPGWKSGYWLFDIDSSIRCATESPLKLPEYHYGGMAIRAARQWTPKEVSFLTSEGDDRLKGNHTRPRWCDIHGLVEGQTAGIALMTHPGNFRFPEPLRIHDKMPYMVYTPSFLGDWEIAPGTIHRARYRFVVHDGEMSPDRLESLWRDYAEPLMAVVE